MEPTSEPENRQSRGVDRFWPVHGIPAPAAGESGPDRGTPRDTTAAHMSDQQAGEAGPTGEHPQVSDQQSQPHDDQSEPDEQSPHPFAPRPNPALTSDTQMVALGSRRPADSLLSGSNGRWNNQGGFPPVETNGHHNGETGPRHGGAPIANGQATAGAGPRSPFAPAGDDLSTAPPFGQPADGAGRSAFMPSADDAAPRPTFGSAGDVPGPRSPFAHTGDDAPARSPFAPADDDSPVGPLYAASPFAPQASGSAPVKVLRPPSDRPAPRMAPPLERES